MLCCLVQCCAAATGTEAASLLPVRLATPSSAHDRRHRKRPHICARHCAAIYQGAAVRNADRDATLRCCRCCRQPLPLRPLRFARLRRLECGACESALLSSSSSLHCPLLHPHRVFVLVCGVSVIAGWSCARLLVLVASGRVAICSLRVPHRIQSDPPEISCPRGQRRNTTANSGNTNDDDNAPRHHHTRKGDDHASHVCALGGATSVMQRHLDARACGTGAPVPLSLFCFSSASVASGLPHCPTASSPACTITQNVRAHTPRGSE